MADGPPTDIPPRSHDRWLLARFAWQTLIAPWPPFAIFLVVIGLIGGLAPWIQIKATTGLIDTVAAHRDSLSTATSLRALLAPYLPWLLPIVAMLIVDKTVVNGRTFQPYMGAQLNERVKERIEGRLFEQALGLRLERFESPTYYDALQRGRTVLGLNLAEELGQLQRLIAYLPSSAVILWQLGLTHWALPLVLLLGSGFTLGWRYRSSRLLLDVEERQAPLRRRLQYWRSLLADRRSAPEVRLFGLGAYIIEAWSALNARLLRQLSTVRLANLGKELPFSLISTGIYGAVIFVLLRSARQGAVTPGAFVALLFAAQQYQDQQRPIMIRVEALLKLVRELRYLDEFLRFPDTELQSGATAPTVIRDRIHFDAVDFTYPGSSRPTLIGINLELRAGERIALVGENGAGKSTMVKLLLGLYQPTAGRILVDDIDLGAIAPQTWRAKIGAVFQEYLRYSLTARENIALGRVDRVDDLDGIVEAAHSSSAAEVIEQLPDGYETLLGKEFEQGIDLSQGQWQKLAIARAYFRDAELLVLDEPASALDALAEQEVYRQFVALSTGKTVLLISHRLASARLADRIVFLQHGRIVQAGTHDELMAVDGPYAELYEMQAEWYRVSA